MYLLKLVNIKFISIALIILFVFGLQNVSFGQCASSTQGPNLSNSQVNNTSIGDYAFTNLSLSKASDNSYSVAQATASILVGNTNYLVLTDFGFELPSTATICGIKADIEKSALGLNILTAVSDNSVKLVKNGVISGQNKATNTAWTTSDAVESYGSNSNKWGLTWTAADINSANFGIAVSAGIVGVLALLPTVQIDNVRLTVYYNNALPVSWLYFEGKRFNDEVQLQWSTASEKNSAYFQIEQSFDGINWQQIGIVDAAGNSDVIKNYSYNLNDKEEFSAYYRIKQVDFDGEFSYSDVINIEGNIASEEFILKRNDALCEVIFNSDENTNWNLSLVNINGAIEKSISYNAKKGLNNIGISNDDKLKGFYFLTLSNGYRKISRKIIFQ